MQKIMMSFCLICTMSLVSTSAMAQSNKKQETEEVANGVLKVAVDESQPRMVKVYGASAGRVDGYSTGIIVSGEGHVLTTQGVFLDGMQVRIVTSDGQTHSASVLKRDRVHQVALLKIAAETPEFFELADELVAEKGDWVVAVSNAFKVAEKTEALSATLGVVSLNSSIEARLNKRDFAYRGDVVLVDCITSNPGAAGGAVVTLDGKLVGMIGKVINSSETNTRLNYAVPSSQLLKFFEGQESEIAETETETVKGELGIKLFKLGGRNNPAYIDRVVRNGAAAEAGLQSDDMIITIAGEKIGTVKDYQEAIESLVADQEVLIIVKRGRELIRIPITPTAVKK
jgi:serine protease Do